MPVRCRAPATSGTTGRGLDRPCRSPRCTSIPAWCDGSRIRRGPRLHRHWGGRGSDVRVPWGASTPRLRSPPGSCPHGAPGAAPTSWRRDAAVGQRRTRRHRGAQPFMQTINQIDGEGNGSGSATWNEAVGNSSRLDPAAPTRTRGPALTVPGAALFPPSSPNHARDQPGSSRRPRRSGRQAGSPALL